MIITNIITKFNCCFCDNFHTAFLFWISCDDHLFFFYKSTLFTCHFDFWWIKLREFLCVFFSFSLSCLFYFICLLQLNFEATCSCAFKVGWRLDNMFTFVSVHLLQYICERLNVKMLHHCFVYKIAIRVLNWPKLSTQIRQCLYWSVFEAKQNLPERVW